MTKNFFISILAPLLLSIIFIILLTPIFSNISQDTNLWFTFSTNTTITNPLTDNITKTNFSTLNYIWPTPGYSKITSTFGYRSAPTTGASTYHGGIDIAAPENSSIISIADGTVSFVGWDGANGYTIIITHSNGFKSIYGHVSPIFLVNPGESVKKGTLIARVGPKYIEKKSYTKFTDKYGNYTNGATTRSAFTFFY